MYYSNSQRQTDVALRFNNLTRTTGLSILSTQWICTLSFQVTSLWHVYFGTLTLSSAPSTQHCCCCKVIVDVMDRKVFAQDNNNLQKSISHTSVIRWSYINYWLSVGLCSVGIIYSKKQQNIWSKFKVM